MRRLTRGDFMRLAALGGTAVATGGMLNACAGSRGSSSPADSSGSSQTTGQATEGGSGPAPGSDTTSGKALVAVFSQYGHTLAVANHINPYFRGTCSRDSLVSTLPGIRKAASHITP